MEINIIITIKNVSLYLYYAIIPENFWDLKFKELKIP